MAKEIEVTVKHVPVRGEATTKTIKIDPTGVPIDDALKAAGYTRSSGNIVVNGEPVGNKTFVKSGDQVTITERAAGS